MPETMSIKQLDDFPLLVLRQTPQWPMPLHSHPFTELVIILGGRGVHYSHNDAYEIAAGDAFVVSGSHGYRDTEKLNLANVIFYPDRLSLPLAEARKLPGYHAFFALEPKYRKRHKFRNRLRLRLDDLAHASELIDKMEREIKEKRPGHEFMAIATLMELIGLISRAYSQRTDTSSRSLFHLGEVLSYVEQHYADQIRLEELSRVAHMSKSSLLRAFQDVTGFAPVAYLIRLRVHRACDILRTSNLNVSETAYRVGFNDSNYFARQFKIVMGCSPREYVRRLR